MQNAKRAGRAQSKTAQSHLIATPKPPGCGHPEACGERGDLNKAADMNLCNQLPSTTCVHVSQTNIAQIQRMSNEPGGFQVGVESGLL
jgi:hypothetical protein